MALTNNSVMGYGTVLQLGGGTLGAGTTQVSTIVFGSAPSAGGITIKAWGLETTLLSSASGTPSGATVQAALNALFGTVYANPFTVTLSTQTLTITADPAGPFAYMPLPAFTIGTNTSLQTVTSTITTPGVTKETYVTVAGVENFPWPAEKRDVETYLTFDVGANQYKRKIAKFKDAGDVQMTLVWTNDLSQNNITGLKSIYDSGQGVDWRIVDTTKNPTPTTTTYGATYYFTGYLSQFGRDGKTADARQQIMASVAIDGPVLQFPPLS